MDPLYSSYGIGNSYFSPYQSFSTNHETPSHITKKSSVTPTKVITGIAALAFGVLLFRQGVKFIGNTLKNSIVGAVKEAKPEINGIVKGALQETENSAGNIVQRTFQHAKTAGQDVIQACHQTAQACTEQYLNHTRVVASRQIGTLTADAASHADCFVRSASRSVANNAGAVINSTANNLTNATQAYVNSTGNAVSQNAGNIADSVLESVQKRNRLFGWLLKKKP